MRCTWRRNKRKDELMDAKRLLAVGIEALFATQRELMERCDHGTLMSVRPEIHKV